jgi:thioredoxin reductase (NADPH)
MTRQRRVGARAGNEPGEAATAPVADHASLDSDAAGGGRHQGAEPTQTTHSSIRAMTAPRPESVAIIGSGPAAWTAAIYAARANLNPIVFEGEPVGTELPGGQLMLTTEIENFPGFPDAISGPDLMDRMKAQAVHHGTRVVSELVTSVDFSQRPFVLTPNYSAPITSHTVIVATGAAAKWIGLENEIRLAKLGGGVSACAVCDGAAPYFRNKRLAVVGGGDTAMEEALYLTKFASEVFVIHRKDKFRASKVMAERVINHPKITIEWNTVVVDVLGENPVEALKLEDTVTGAQRELEVGGLFVAIGHTPNTGFLGGQLELTPFNYIKVAPWRTVTSVEGVFAAGDAIDDYYRQAITSAGTGCMAALEAERWLAHHGIGESPMLDTAVAPVVIADCETGSVA